MNETDQDLLRRYARGRSEDAFAEIVHRHLNLVYSAALRQVRSPQLAEEVAQSVFADLARNAPSLASGTILTAWLYQVARRSAIDVVRRETRRQMREQIATEMNAMNATADDWAHIDPILDDAMSALDETDRAAVLLRYFENKSLREVGEALGTSDDAAQKRVSRAVERLREFFAKRGVTVGASGLIVAISANAVQAAPAGLAATISAAAALFGVTSAAASTAAATKAITMTTLQKTVVGAVLVTAIGTGIYEAHQASSARAQIQALARQHEQFTEQIDQLTRERDDAATKLAASRERDGERLGRATAELAKLRTEVAQLRSRLAATATAAGTNETDWADATLRTWKAKLKMVKQRFDEWPGKKCPELVLLTEADWMNELSKRPLDTEEQIRETMSALRFTAKVKFEKEIQNGLSRFGADNPQQYPPDLGQLAPYLNPAVQPMLEEYEIAPPGKVAIYSPGPPNFDMAKRWALVEKGAGSNPHDGTIHSDPDHDMFIIIYPGGHAAYGPARKVAPTE